MPPSLETRRADLRAEQLAKLRRLIAELVPANRFYASRLRAAGLASGPRDLEEFTSRMPFTTKRELVETSGESRPTAPI